MLHYLIGGRYRPKSKETNALVVALSVLGSTSALLSMSEKAMLLTIIFDRFVTSSLLQGYRIKQYY
jgi:hypothetical protein